MAVLMILAMTIHETGTIAEKPGHRDSPGETGTVGMFAPISCTKYFRYHFVLSIDIVCKALHLFTQIL